MRRKTAPIEFAKRRVDTAILPLCPLPRSPSKTGSVFSAGALALALGACRSEHVTVEPQQVASPPTASVSNEEVLEPPPFVIKVAPAEPVEPVTGKAAKPAPVPTTVVIRPGKKSVCFAGQLPLSL
jgi:hypothetical protein